MKLRHARIVRELAEVVAIVLAGGWALYVFVFQNVIVPGMAQPNPTFAIHMEHVGNDGPFAVVRIDEDIANQGKDPVYFLAYAVTVLSEHVVPLATPPSVAAGTEFLYADTRFAGPAVAFRHVVVTTRGNPSSPRDIIVLPGQSVAFSLEFYVRRAPLTRLEARIAAVYTKEPRSVPTVLDIRPGGVASFKLPPNTNGIYRIGATVAELDLTAQ